jgi:molecular chaperone DnaK
MITLREKFLIVRVGKHGACRWFLRHVTSTNGSTLGALVTPNRRVAPRLGSSTRILWSIVGQHDIQIDRLRDVSASGARVATEAVPRTGEEIRFDLLDDAGERIATGLARVVWVDAARGMGIAFLALGIDLALVAALGAQQGGAGPRPPSLPGQVGGPPPFPGEHLVAAVTAAAQEVGDVDLLDDIDETAPQIEPLAVRPTGLIIGIDLGTTNTCASYVVDGRAKIIPGRTGSNTIPSMITFDPDGSFHVGQRAADRQILQPLRTVYGSKRLVGRTFRAELAADLQEHFAYPLAEADGQRFGARIGEDVISMDTIAARILEEVRSTAEAHLGVTVEAAVITVPAYFSEVQREAVRRAAAEAKLVVQRIVNEPTAAAVAYGHKQTKKARVAVWDFGGGTFDFSVVDLSAGQLEVLATGGDNFVGGSDFDDLVASHLLVEFQRAEGIELDPSPQQIARLREVAELAKRALSVQTEYVAELPEFTREPLKALRVEITRERFDAITANLVLRTVQIATEVMSARKLGFEDIDDVILVGGSTRVPAVQNAVSKLFGRRPSRRINPDEAVALGAALLAAEIGSGSAPTLLDILPISVGYGSAGLHFAPIVARNERLPVEREVTVDADFLGSVSMPLFQGESGDVTRNEYLCSALVDDRALQDGGRVTFRLSFDEHCVMAVDARDARTGRKLATKLDRTRGLDDILSDLGKSKARGAPVEPARPEPDPWKLPPSPLGKVLGRLFKLFGR